MTKKRKKQYGSTASNHGIKGKSPPQETLIEIKRLNSNLCSIYNIIEQVFFVNEVFFKMLFSSQGAFLPSRSFLYIILTNTLSYESTG